MDLSLDLKYNNSAGRLLGILNAIKQNGNGAYIELFPKIFGNDDTPEKLSKIQKLSLTFDAIHELQALYTQVVSDIQKGSLSKEQIEVALRGILSVRETINPENLSSRFRAITEAEAAMLELCAAGLDICSDASEEDIDGLRQSIDDLYRTANKPETNETLRTVILELARISRTSIDLYEIRGPEGLKAAFKGMIGELSEILFTGVSEETKEEIQKSEAWTKVCQHLHKFDTVASKLMKYRPLLEGSARLFLGQ
ncbi:MAG: hypothetical protein ACSHYA_16725 [Opitutaceae bacterium]